MRNLHSLAFAGEIIVIIVIVIITIVIFEVIFIVMTTSAFALITIAG